MQLSAASDCSHILGKELNCYRTLLKFRDDVYLVVFAIRRDPVAVELEGWFIYFAISESSPSDCMQEKSFFCRIRWVLGQTWRPAICCSYHVSAFYSFLLPTLDVFQWVCDITRLSTIIRCFFQVNMICLGKCIHTHAHTHTQTPHFTVIKTVKFLKHN